MFIFSMQSKELLQTSSGLRHNQHLQLFSTQKNQQNMQVLAPNGLGKLFFFFLQKSKGGKDLGGVKYVFSCLLAQCTPSPLCSLLQRVITYMTVCQRRSLHLLGGSFAVLNLFQASLCEIT